MLTIPMTTKITITTTTTTTKKNKNHNKINNGTNNNKTLDYTKIPTIFCIYYCYEL